MRLALVILAVLSATAACAGEAVDPLAALPRPPRIRPTPIAAPAELTQAAPGIRIGTDRVAIEGAVLIDQGPADGLEVLACFDGGKTHEALLRLGNASGQALRVLMSTVLHLADGQPAVEGSGIPARGTPLRVLVQWQRPGEEQWVEIDASSCIRDRVIDAGYPPLPFVYTGSRMIVTPDTGADGRTVQHERFALDNTKSVIVNYDEPDALLASPFPGARTDDRFEANSAVVPPPKTPVRVVFLRVDLPLTLDLSANGALTAPGSTTALDDAALAAALGRAFAADVKPALYAVAVRVDPATPHDADVAARARILAAAAAAKVWAVPVFVPEALGR